MIAKKLCGILFGLCIIYVSSFAQLATPPRVIPPSPDAAALGKYGQYPVSMSTGLVDISIPIYKIHTNSIELPISLSYHPSGIKVNDVSTWVGLGWVLNAGGVVTRVVKEKPDDGFGVVNQMHDRAFYNSLTDPLDLYSRFHHLSEDIQDLAVDSESDVYYYNIGGVSGSFRYNTNGDVIQIPLTENSIEFDRILDNFKITDTNGVIYVFSDKEKNRQGTPDALSEFPFTSSWYLTKIITPESEEIFFNYFEDESYYTEYSEGFVVQECYSGCSGSPNNTGQRTLSLVQVEQTKILESIVFPGGKINFGTTGDRLDRRKYRLEDIQIENNTGEVVKSISLEHCYFTPSGVTTGDGIARDNQYNMHFNYRLKLDGILVEDKKYDFEYNTSALLPKYYNVSEIGGNVAKTFYGQDNWGYYNGVTTNSNFKTLAPESQYSEHPLADRSVNEEAAQACILNKIIYPTGGVTEFVYESNRGENEELYGGLRISKIISFDTQGGRLVKTYNYESPLSNFYDYENIAGYVYSRNLHYQVHDEHRNYYVSQPPVPLTFSGGASVFYRKVTEYNGTEENYSDKSISLFESIKDIEYNGTNLEYGFSSDFFPKYKYYTFNLSWKRGQPSETFIYSRANETDKLIKHIKNYYTKYLESEAKVGFYVFKNDLYFPNPGEFNERIPEDVEIVKDRFQYDDHRIKTGIKKLKKTVETVYSGDGDILNTTEYFYDRLNNQHEVSHIISKGSDGSVLKQTFQYPNDLKTGDPEDIYTKMSEKNIISPVIIETKYKDDQIVESVRSNYIDWDNGIYAQETIDVKIGDNDYETRLHFHGYDDNKNILSVSKERDIRKNYIWGYQNLVNLKPDRFKNAYPVVVIEGPEDYHVPDLLTNTIKNHAFVAGTNYSDTQLDVDFLNTQLSTLRNSPGYKVTSYTYAPLIGMTSSTDPSGITTYYEYDSNGRLKRVRDHEGKFLKTYEYKTINQ